MLVSPFLSVVAGLPARPYQAAPHNLASLRGVEIFGDMPQRTKEHAPLSPSADPHHWHDRAFNPGMVFTTERCRRQHLIGRVHMHVILLGVHGKIIESLSNGVFVIGDLYGVVDDPAGMGYPLSAHQVLIVRTLAESVRHAAMPSANPYA